MNAATADTLSADYIKLASLLQLPERDAQDQTTTIVAVKHWLSSQKDVLLILDNADELEIVPAFLPLEGMANGHILLTTRAQAVGGIARPCAIKKMESHEGVLFLLRRAQLLADETLFHQVTKKDREQAEAIVTALDGLPLALDQAGAYLEETGCSLSEYLDLYQSHRSFLLQQRGLFSAGHPDPVASTWSLSFQIIEQAKRAAADLLRFCAFLSPDAIPEELITEGAVDLGTPLETIATDRLKLNEAMREALRYSLLQRNPKEQLLSMHRLVQAVIKDGMNQQLQQLWAEAAVRAMNRVFPTTRIADWPLCQKYLPHVQECALHITRWQMSFPEAAHLLNQAGVYQYKRGLYTEAELLLQQALDVYERALGPTHLTTVISLNDKAMLYEAQGQYEQAKALYQRAIAISEQVEGTEHSSTANILYTLAQFYLIQSQYAEAEPILRRAIAIYEKVLGLDHPSTQHALQTFAWFYQNQHVSTPDDLPVQHAHEGQTSTPPRTQEKEQPREKELLSHLSLATLADHCAHTLKRLRHPESHNDQYCLEIFHRAILHRDHQAWEVVQQHFHSLVRGWLHRHPKKEIAYQLDSEENYIAQAFARFWMAAAHNEQAEFSSLTAALRYLRTCLDGAILDTLRAVRQPQLAPLQEPDVSERAIEEIEREEAWQALYGLLSNKREQRLFYLHFYCGLSPREIVQRFPQEFTSKQEVYRLRHTILDRLRRNAEMLRWKLEA